MGNEGPWPAQCEKAALFARQFYEREGDYAPVLDVLTADGSRHVIYPATTEPATFVAVRRNLGPALAWCLSLLGSVVDKKGSVEEQYRCLMVLGRDVGGCWYGNLWPLCEDGRLGEVRPVMDARVAMDVLLGGGGQ